jgi:predicted phage terminase large subunit-like protein
MYAVAPEWQAGDWLVDRNAAWTEAFIDQITVFPKGRNDDMCDAMSQAACWLLKRPTETFRISNAFTGEVLHDYP